MIAYTDRNGIIKLAKSCPTSCLPIAQDDDAEKLLTDIIAIANLASDGKTLLIPGVAEAGDNENKALEAVMLFAHKLKKSLPN